MSVTIYIQWETGCPFVVILACGLIDNILVELKNMSSTRFSFLVDLKRNAPYISINNYFQLNNVQYTAYAYCSVHSLCLLFSTQLMLIVQYTAYAYCSVHSLCLLFSTQLMLSIALLH